MNPRINMITLGVRDLAAEVDEVVHKAVRAGAKLAKQPRKTDWGGYAGYFAHPEGFLWEVAHNPHFWVGPKD
ncbi:MAG: VOC family protein [Burkholderiales bacterium]